MDNYVIGKDIQAIISKLDVLQESLDKQSSTKSGASSFSDQFDQGRPETRVYRYVDNVYGVNVTQPHDDHLTYKFHNFSPRSAALNNASLEFYPSGQWNFNGSFVNPSTTSKLYGKLEWVVDDITWDKIWENWVYTNVTIPLEFPLFKLDVHKYYSFISSHVVYIKMYIDWFID